jgi:hypothetical protein
MDRRHRYFAGLLSLVCAACVGAIGDEDGSAKTPGAGGSASDDADGLANFTAAPGSLRRLTVSEYASTVHDLLGEVRIPDGLEGDSFDQGFSTVGAAKVSIGATAVEKFDAAALDLAHQVFSDPARRSALVGCTPSATDSACVTTFLGAFGRRAFRRPLAADEMDRYVTVSSKATTAFGGDPWRGLEYAIATVLESPYFLYRTEVGEPDPTHAGRRRYTSHEMAGRLSYFLWGTTPDDALLDSADRGELTTKEGVQAATARLLASPRAEAGLMRFFGEHFSLGQLDRLAKDQNVYPTFKDGLGVAMHGEIERMLKSVVQGDGDFRSLFDMPKTWVNRELATLYGLPAPNGADFVEVTLPANGPRVGLLTTAGVLALNARNGRSAPTLRGKFITGRLLCWEPGDPPPNANETMVNDPSSAAGGWKTMRQRLAAHRANPACASCHDTLDPPGLALESFDGIGAYRETDHGETLDLSGSLGAASFTGARGLAAALRQDARIPECFARQVYRFASGHRETRGEEPIITQLTSRSLEQGLRLRALVLEIVKSDGFRFVADPR